MRTKPERGLSRLLDAVRDNTFAARIEILEEAGRGGMGVVYRARVRESGAAIAIKELSAGDMVDVERFVREADALEQLEHPGIVRYLEHGAMRHGRHYLAIEWLDGESLRDRLRRGSLTTVRAVDVARQVAEALAHAHDAGIVHRDLKPGNLMLLETETEAYRVVLVDFGIARRVDAEHEDLTRTGQIVGTPGYFAPEQLTEEGIIEGRTDVFALGCVLYEMITGTRAFGGDEIVKVLVEVMIREPEPIAQVRHDVPHRLATLVDAMLCKDVEARPTARDVAAELAAIGRAISTNDSSVLEITTPLAAEPATVDQPVTVDATPARVDRRTGQAFMTKRRTLTALAALACVAALVVAWQWLSRETDRALNTDPSAESAPPFDELAFAAFRAASWHEATARLRTVTADQPTDAAAHLRLAIWQLPGSPSTARKSYQMALRFRAKLDERQAALLDATEPYLREPWDLAAWQQGLERYLESNPDDLEARFYLALALRKRLDFEGAVGVLDRIVAADSQMVVAWELRGAALSMMGDASGALANHSRCLADNPSAPSCLASRAVSHMRRGDCESMRKDASRLTSVAPDDPNAHRQLANALLATGAPTPSVTLAIERALALQKGDATSPLAATARRAFVVGDFDRAEKDLIAWSEAMRQRLDQYDSAEPAILLMRLYAEQNRPADAARVAKDYLDHIASRGAPSGGDLSIHFYVPLARAGKLDEPSLEAARESWLDAYRKKWRDAGRDTGDEFAWIAWSTMWGGLETAAEANKAVAAMPANIPATVVGGRWPVMDLNIGRAFVLAGEPARALPHLERAARSCERLGEPRLHPTANAWWGAALAKTGRSAEAISALDRALAAWGNAPKSRTVSMAREQLKTLKVSKTNP